MRAYFKLWLLLLFAFLIMSFIADLKNVRLFDFPIEQMRFASDRIMEEKDIGKLSENSGYIYQKNKMYPTDSLEVDTIPKTLLFVGDSMIEGMCRRLGAYTEANKYSLYTVIWYGSTTKSWAERNLLAKYVKQYKPDFIFISIGGNELFIRNIEHRRKYVHKILENTGGIPFLWIGPPNWKEDTGINSLILSEVGRSSFFLSKNLKFERSSDGRHPTWESSYMWMDSVISSVSKSGHLKFKLKKPDKLVGKPTKIIMLSPDD